MRLVTWNCRVGGFRKKAKHIAPFRPDVLTVQEVEPLDSVLIFGGEDQPTFRDRISDPLYWRRSIGVFSYTGVELASVDADTPLYGFRRYRAQRNGLVFQVVAVWTSATKSRQTSYMQAIEGVREHAGWIAQAPTVIMGDFNDNASYRLGHWPQLLELLQPLRLVSAYHEYFKEPFGSESRPTHFFTGKETSPFHLDYCFVPQDWAPRISNVHVGTYADWPSVSDHVPVIVDLDL
ncbi:MAG: endonuclease/exonuclease/phosphatase family protein [Vicinamibacterales bacterium]